jgi:Predicted transcriptional regulator
MIKPKTEPYIELLSWYGWLSTTHLATLTGNPEYSVRRHLLALEKGGWITSRRVSVDRINPSGLGSAPKLWRLSEATCKQRKEALAAWPNNLAHDYRVRDVLAWGVTNGATRIAYKGLEWTNVTPDALVIIPQPECPFCGIVEVDRHTEGLRVWEQKADAYAVFFAGKPSGLYDATDCAVPTLLIVVESTARIPGIARSIGVLDQLAWFTTDLITWTNQGEVKPLLPPA